MPWAMDMMPATAIAIIISWALTDAPVSATESIVNSPWLPAVGTRSMAVAMMSDDNQTCLPFEGMTPVKLCSVEQTAPHDREGDSRW